MSKSKVRDIVSERLTEIRLWYASGGPWAIPRLLGKLIAGAVLCVVGLVVAFIVAGALGILSGTYVRFMHDGSRLYFGVGRNWAEHVDQPEPQGAWTVSGKTPFISLSTVAMRFDMNDAKGRRLSADEAISRQYFKVQDLGAGTKYLPCIDGSSTPVVVTTADRVDQIMVELIGLPGTIGLIPLDEYNDWLRKIGGAKKGER